jgi:hypothetical protein
MTIIGGVARTSKGHSKEAQQHYDRAAEIIRSLKCAESCRLFEDIEDKPCGGERQFCHQHLIERAVEVG